MSKTIKIPSNYGSRITVVINNTAYVYAAGETVTVPDEVAEVISNQFSMRPHGLRKSLFDEDHVEMIEELEGEISASSTGGGVLIVHMDETMHLDKTWQEIVDAGFAVINAESNGGIMIYQLTGFGEEQNMFVLWFNNELFVADSADGYPVYYDQGGGDQGGGGAT